MKYIANCDAKFKYPYWTGYHKIEEGSTLYVMEFIGEMATSRVKVQKENKENYLDS